MFSEDALAFLNNLPETTNSGLWAIELRDGLLKLFEDIDHIVINVNVSADPFNKIEESFEEVQLIRSLIDSKTGRSKARVNRHAANSNPKWEQLLEGGKDLNFPFEKYHEPIGLDLAMSNSNYCGTLIFFRLKEKPPISEETLRKLDQIKRFLEFIFTSHICKRLALRPVDGAFNTMIKRIGGEKKLTEREMEILMMLIGGSSYDEIAETLFISRNTVNSHIARLYKKIGATSVKEIFARYLTPRSGIDIKP